MKRFLIILSILALVFCAADSFAKKKLNWTRCKLSQIDFDDGDSFKCRGKAIRVLGIDTPEIAHPKHGIAKDQPYGKNAAAFTKKLLTKAKRVVIIRGGPVKERSSHGVNKDKYGRTLAHVLVDGELLGVMLIKARLAYETVSHFGDNGMPEYAMAIKEAAKTSPKPKFQKPWLWRKKNRKK